VNTLEFVTKNDEGEPIGGMVAGNWYWNGLEIKTLWVKENYRGLGVGSKLLNYMESISQEKGPTVSMVDSFDFQSEELYLKKGNKSIGEIKNFPEGERRIYCSKIL